jgi:tripartite-type tricarboxylate transporter receptor subunit TctC
MTSKIFACVMLVLFSLPLGAQTWPSKPIRLIVTFSPGGTSDIVARLMQPQLQERLGQPVLVENRPGGGATIGANAVAQAEADGYTLLLNNTAPMSLSPMMMDKPPYDPMRSFTHIAYIGAVPNVMLVHPSVPAKNLAEFVTWAKAQSGGVNYSGAGSTGTIGHIVGELFKSQAGLNLVYIGYKGSAPMLQDLLAGRLLFAIDGLPQNVPHIREGKLRALAVTSTQREKLAPEVLSVVESGYPSLVAENFVGISGPAKLPPAVVERIHKAAVDSVAVPQVQQRLGELGFTTRQMSSGEFTAFVEKQVTSWAEPVRASGAKLQ